MITLDNVSKSFGRTVAVDDVSFTVDRGEVVGFLGPNGAGKSTTMRLITNFLEPDAGAVLIDGVDVREDPVAARRRIGYLPENNPLYDDMLVAEYLRFVGELRGVEMDGPGSALDDTVQATGIAEVFYRPIGELSKGYKQRLGLAAAILHRPDFLILDEPTEGLDPNQRQEIRRLIREVGKEHTVILSTHVLPEVEETCRRIIVIHEGKIVADGSTEDLMVQARDTGAKRTIVVEVRGEGVAAEVVKLPNVEEVTDESESEGRTRLTLAVGTGPDPRPEIFRLAKAKDWVLWELHEETASLQDLFSQLTR
ncbi:MAG: ATP-binding cassette domain-containing protein [Gemmatimonadetes bacterium]|nr:ATP-binding cassette domain-containing protein [Gemmatimonadota bacterium]NIO31699.1 ATP-binding cassette domain-containing protein [Gemmatimonadota bacterium]